ncbi:envelope stress response membrane protein PspC [Desulfonatronum lacustre]|uniref:envelope stress response membrane protein PspC n=1 Tax=Desulfonatronum lacustre TaxID=66849 RepID=UPI00055276D2|nr:envelope stress response membrane protein PspC [Desulfonatronum lacustre]
MIDHAGRDRLYRSRSGMILGVCKGLARYFDVSLFWTRVIAVLLMFFTGFWPLVGIYLLAGFLLKPEPVLPLNNDEESDFYQAYARSRNEGLSRIKSKFDRLDKRIRRLENVVTSKEFDWDRRFKR